MRRMPIAVLVVLVAATAHAQPYTYADLEVLDRAASWDELDRHLEDVPPSKRDARWQAFLEHAAVGQLASREHDSEAAMTAADGFTRRFPTVKRSADFMARRAAAGLGALASCVDDDDGLCMARFVDYVAADPANVKLATEAALLIGAGAQPAMAIPFFHRALTGKKAPAECNRTELGRAVRAALELPASDPRVAPAQTLAADVCWDALAETLVHRVLEANDAYRKNTCGLLRSKKALTAITSTRCH
jgi:hypothetical protein